MGMQNYVDPQYFQPSAGAALASSTSEAALGLSAWPVPAGFFYVGRTVKLEAWGKVSTTSAPTFRLRLRYGGLAGSVLVDWTALTLGSSITNIIWRVVVTVVCQAVGSGTSGSLFAFGQLTGGAGLFSTDKPQMGSSAGASAPAAVGVDTTIAQDMVLSGQWGTSNASNTATCVAADWIAIN